jgi:hypothetical protein
MLTLAFRRMFSPMPAIVLTAFKLNSLHLGWRSLALLCSR